VSVAIPEMQIVAHRDLTAKQARSLTEQIKSSMGDLMGQVVKAFLGRAWIALGYESWPDYIKGEFNHAPLVLPREERKAVAALLRGQGMSTRAIGAATGTSDFTARNDLAGAMNLASDREPVQVTGLDGKNYSVTCPRPAAEQPAPPQATITCPTCGGTGRITE
jgi:hypothetical protein